VQANAGAAGYYLVLYQGDLLNALLKDSQRALTLPEKVALVGNIDFLTHDGKIPLGTALALEPGLARDPTRQVVAKTMDTTTGLQDNLVPPDLVPRYRQYLLDVYGERARALGWKGKPDESDDVRLLRRRLLDVVANQAEDPELIAQAKQLALAWLDDHKAVDPNLVNVVLSTAARHGDRELYQRVLAAARKETEENLRERLLFSLGMFRDPAIINDALAIMLSADFDPRQSVVILYGAVESPAGRDLAYDFVKENWNALTARLPTDYGASLPYVAQGFCDAGHYQDAKAFFEGHATEFTGGPRVLSQVLESINLCIAYKHAQESSVAEFLAKFKSENGEGAN